jgi:hypothetical protein
MRAPPRSSRLAALAALLFSLSGPSTLAAQSWFAQLGPETAGATGTGYATFSLIGPARTTLAISASWSGLSGPTTVAHIHCCTAVAETGTVGVAVTPGTLPGFPTGLMMGSYSATIDLTDPASYTTSFFNNFGGGTAPMAQKALTDAFGTGQAYFNIHTTAFPPGEIRGFIQPVPEPASALLLTTGLVLLGAAARRRQRR